MKRLFVGILMVMVMVVGMVNIVSADNELTKEQIENRKKFSKTQVSSGIWVIDRYVDNFGEENGAYFIHNRPSIRGKFSNTATHNSRLKVYFLIDGSYKMALQLYEYAGNNPVKSYSIPDVYYVNIKDKHGKIIRMRATNYNDRLYFEKSSSLKLHRLFMKGDIIKFHIREQESNTSNYKFNVNTKGYNSVYKKLQEKRKLKK